MIPRLDISMIVSMETWPRRIWMSLRMSWVDMAFCCPIPDGEGINGEAWLGRGTCHDLEVEIVHSIED